MALFELTTGGAFSRVPSTTFAAQHVLERADLQSALRSHIDVIGAQQCRLAWDRHLIRCWSCLASHTRSLQA